MEEIHQAIKSEIDKFNHNVTLVKSPDTLMRILRTTYYLNDSLNYFLDNEDETKISNVSYRC